MHTKKCNPCIRIDGAKISKKIVTLPEFAQNCLLKVTNIKTFYHSQERN
jgi:hypothetical protein